MHTRMKNRLKFSTLLLAVLQSILLACGFEVELKHRDFGVPHSGNRLHRVQRAVAASKSRSRRLNDAESPLFYSDDDQAYNMEFELGTPPVKFQALMDTGSDLLWVQCVPCERCYRQKGPMLIPANSSSYGQVPCGDPLCKSLGRCLEDTCRYGYGYGDGTSTRGNLAYEAITMQTTSGAKVNLGRVAFGCGRNNTDGFGTFGGLVGLAQGPLSLISQLGTQFEHRFSYCLTSYDAAPTKTSTMYFGASAKLKGPGVKTTPIIHNENRNPSYYFINVEDISVQGVPIQVARGGSVRDSMVNKTIIDSGTTVTYLPTEVYSALRAALQNEISLPALNGTNAGRLYEDPFLDLCYDRACDMKYKFPSLTFHFTDAAIDIPFENHFVAINEDASHVCFAMVPTGGLPIIGNFLHQNFLVSYDVAASQISFQPASC